MDLILVILTGIVAFFVALTVHEASHALVSNWQGDPTARLLGRVSLNPLSHIDPFGTILLPLMLLIVSKGTWAFGWAKPVPINPNNLRNRRLGTALIALAGPAANFILAFISGYVLKFIIISAILPPTNLLIIFFLNLLTINIVLAVFNLIPVPPLDGSKVLFSILPDSLNHIKYFLDKWGFVFLFVVIIMGSDIISDLLGFFLEIIVRIIGLPVLY